jgi:hypothetical protein
MTCDGCARVEFGVHFSALSVFKATFPAPTGSCLAGCGRAATHHRARTVGSIVSCNVRLRCCGRLVPMLTCGRSRPGRIRKQKPVTRRGLKGCGTICASTNGPTSYQADWSTQRLSRAARTLDWLMKPTVLIFPTSTRLQSAASLFSSQGQI